jgi:hypothetical protein
VVSLKTKRIDERKNNKFDPYVEASELSKRIGVFARSLFALPKSTFECKKPAISGLFLKQRVRLHATTVFVGTGIDLDPIADFHERWHGDDEASAFEFGGL